MLSDHGYHLGDQNHWAKTTNYEQALHIPLIISGAPIKSKNRKTDALVESVDVLPTLLDICGLPILDYLEGTSMVPVLENPEIEWKKAAFSRQPIGSLSEMYGSSIRTDRYRYVEWKVVDTGEIKAQELYDYEMDHREVYNLVNLPEYKEVLRELSELLNKGWKASLPDGVINTSKNKPAPLSFASKGEGDYWRKAWVKKYGGNENMNWKEAMKFKKQYEIKNKE